MRVRLFANFTGYNGLELYCQPSTKGEEEFIGSILVVTEHRNIEAVNLYCYYTDFIW